MIKLEKTEVVGLEAAIRGMRNPMNSWDKSDSELYRNVDCGSYEHCSTCDNRFSMICCNQHIGENDLCLMRKLAKGGPVHAKYRRMITVYVDITAPLYWWKEFDTYKIGTVANSCSTMHKVYDKEFTLEDFSHEHLLNNPHEPLNVKGMELTTSVFFMQTIVNVLNTYRQKYLETKDKIYWWQIIQILPSSYNQKRTVMLNYEVLAGIYPMRKNHKLDEWRDFCNWIEKLPYSEIIVGEQNDD